MPLSSHLVNIEVGLYDRFVKFLLLFQIYTTKSSYNNIQIE